METLDRAALLHRPFTYADARAAGIPRRTLERMLAERQLRRVLRDVYVVDGLADTVELRAAAAALVAPPHAVAVDRTAAWLWGCDLRSPGERHRMPALELFVPRAASG